MPLTKRENQIFVRLAMVTPRTSSIKVIQKEVKKGKPICIAVQSKTFWTRLSISSLIGITTTLFTCDLKELMGLVRDNVKRELRRRHNLNVNTSAEDESEDSEEINKKIYDTNRWCMDIASKIYEVEVLDEQNETLTAITNDTEWQTCVAMAKKSKENIEVVVKCELRYKEKIKRKRVSKNNNNNNNSSSSSSSSSNTTTGKQTHSNTSKGGGFNGNDGDDGNVIDMRSIKRTKHVTTDLTVLMLENFVQTTPIPFRMFFSKRPVRVKKEILGIGPKHNSSNVVFVFSGASFPENEESASWNRTVEIIGTFTKVGTEQSDRETLQNSLIDLSKSMVVYKKKVLNKEDTDDDNYCDGVLTETFCGGSGLLEFRERVKEIDTQITSINIDWTGTNFYYSFSMNGAKVDDVFKGLEDLRAQLEKELLKTIAGRTGSTIKRKILAALIREGERSLISNESTSSEFSLEEIDEYVKRSFNCNFFSPVDIVISRSLLAGEKYDEKKKVDLLKTGAAQPYLNSKATQEYDNEELVLNQKQLKENSISLREALRNSSGTFLVCRNNIEKLINMIPPENSKQFQLVGTLTEKENTLNAWALGLNSGKSGIPPFTVSTSDSSSSSIGDFLNDKNKKVERLDLINLVPIAEIFERILQVHAPKFGPLHSNTDSGSSSSSSSSSGNMGGGNMGGGNMGGAGIMNIQLLADAIKNQARSNYFSKLKFVQQDAVPSLMMTKTYRQLRCLNETELYKVLNLPDHSSNRRLVRQCLDRYGTPNAMNPFNDPQVKALRLEMQENLDACMEAWLYTDAVRHQQVITVVQQCYKDLETKKKSEAWERIHSEGDRRAIPDVDHPCVLLLMSVASYTGFLKNN